MDHLETEMEGKGGSRGAALPGEIWTVPAGRSYASHARGGEIRYAVLAVNPGSSVDFASHAGLMDERLRRLVEDAVSACHGADEISRLRAEELSHEIAGHCSNPNFVADKRSEKMIGNFLSGSRCKDLRDYVFDNLSSPLRLEDLSRVAGMSPHRFLVAFRRAFGFTPAQYLIRERVRAAMRLLRDTRYEITRVAFDCGFSSHSHLSTVFKRYTGKSPRDYRAGV